MSTHSQKCKRKLITYAWLNHTDIRKLILQIEKLEARNCVLEVKNYELKLSAVKNG